MDLLDQVVFHGLHDCPLPGRGHAADVVPSSLTPPHNAPQPAPSIKWTIPDTSRPSDNLYRDAGSIWLAGMSVRWFS